MESQHTNEPIRILLADDDIDDHYIFELALKALPFNTDLVMVENGESLLAYLSENIENLPDILFLDHNMPCLNGLECILEMKMNPALQHVPIILYSTYIHESYADVLYEAGVYYYLCKTVISKLERILHIVLMQIIENKFTQPNRENFTLQCIE